VLVLLTNESIGNAKPMVAIEQGSTVDWLMENIGNAKTMIPAERWPRKDG